jgi:hypothetical protein
LALHVIQEDDVAILCIPSYIGEVYNAFDDRIADVRKQNASVPV